ncbi:MAG: hypothetical protein LBE56_07105, partial [Tannerella sp.]|jgi:hypothetical protein|nr:hypothetical protein [Tannerella sp.]
MLSFINPGMFFSSRAEFDGSEKTWGLISGFAGIIFVSGLIISVIGNVIERRVDNISNGRIHYYFNNHIVIIGYDRMSVGLIGQFAKDQRYSDAEIVLMTTQAVPGVRHELFSRLDSRIEKKVTIVSGNRTSAEDLKRLQISRCREVFILGEKEEYDNDSLDIECIKRIYDVLSEKQTGRIVRCNVRFEYQSTFAVFQRRDIEGIKDRIDFVPFNYEEIWAQKVFVSGKYESLAKDGQTAGIEYTPLDREGIRADSSQQVHLVVIGMSTMGIAMGIQAAHLCHFPNFVTKGIKTRITFIDEQADVEMNYLRGRYRHLFHETEVLYREVTSSNMMDDSILNHQAVRINPRDTKELFTDIEFEFIKARVEYPAIQNYIADLSGNGNLCLTIAVCISSPPRALAAGLYLPDGVYDNHIPVLVRQDIPYCTLDMLSNDGKYMQVKPFGMLENCLDLRKADDTVPMMVNYVYSRGAPEQFPENEMIEMWRHLPVAHKWSNRYQADSIKLKIRSFVDNPGGLLNNGEIELLSKVEHNRWNMEKLLMGYRATTSEEKELIAKDLSQKNFLKKHYFAHHDICPFDSLQVDETGVHAGEYDRRISAALPLIALNDKSLREYLQQFTRQ